MAIRRARLGFYSIVLFVFCGYNTPSWRDPLFLQNADPPMNTGFFVPRSREPAVRDHTFFAAASYRKIFLNDVRLANSPNRD